MIIIDILFINLKENYIEYLKKNMLTRPLCTIEFYLGISWNYNISKYLFQVLLDLR